MPDYSNNKFLWIAKSPTLCFGILNHFKLEKISDLYKTSFYQKIEEKFTPEIFGVFKKQLESVWHTNDVSSELSEPKGPRLS